MLKAEKEMSKLDAFWQNRGGGFPFEGYCLLGHFTAFYAVAWSHAASGYTKEAVRTLEKAAYLLRLDDHDLLDHTLWPFSSWDVAANLQSLKDGGHFRGRWARATLSLEAQRTPPLKQNKQITITKQN